MKIVSFWRDHELRFGILVDEAILDAASAASVLPQEQEAFFRDAVSFAAATQRSSRPIN